MSKITIPPAALEAGARAIEKSLKTARITLESEDGYKPEARAAFLAIVSAWGGMQHDNYVIVLPLPTEASDDP
tara:strand:+ start:1259 stop:1477 length:219 start_codon:yes stop_codon:yes gene_type:complete